MSDYRFGPVHVQERGYQNSRLKYVTRETDKRHGEALESNYLTLYLNE